MGTDANRSVCALCGSADFKPFWKKDFVMGVCNQCGLVYMNPVDWDMLDDLYRNKYDYAKLGSERFPAPSPWDRERGAWVDSFFEQTGTKRRLVDIGCGAGKLLSVFSAGKWDRCGVEPDKDSATYAHNSRGLDVQNCFLAQAKLDDGVFDAVIMASTFEHLQDPNAELKVMARILKPDGKLFLEVPNLEHPHGFYIDFAYSTGFVPTPEHLFCYSLKSLRAMLAKNGFRVVANSVTRENMRVVAVLDSTVSSENFPTDNPVLVYSMLKAFKLHNRLHWPLDVARRVAENALIYLFPKKLVNFLRSMRQNREKSTRTESGQN